MDYAKVMSALRRRRWMILFAVLVCTALTAFATTRMKREYQASAGLMPQSDALSDLRDLGTAPDVAPEKLELQAKQDRIKTVAAVVTSGEVLGQVIRDLKLNTTPEDLKEQLEVKEVTTELIRVSYKDQDPARATAVINKLVDTFTVFFRDLRSQEARKQRELFEREQVKAERELRTASANLEQFKRNGGLSDLGEQTRTSIAAARQVEQDRNAAEAELRQVAGLLQSAQAQLQSTPAMREEIRSVPQTALIQKLKEEVSDLQAALRKEEQTRTDEHPAVVSLKKQLEAKESRLAKAEQTPQVERSQIPNVELAAARDKVRTLQAQQRGLEAKLAKLNTQHTTVQARVSALNGKDVQLNTLTQRYAMAEKRLTDVMGRLSQARNVSNQMQGTPIAVMDRTSEQNPPADLSQGRTLRLTAMAFVMSLAMCVALAVGLEMADRRVRTVGDVETLTQLPVASVVPALPGRRKQSQLCLTTHNDPASHLAEAYHFLANHILRQTLRRESTVLMGATGRPGQGATTSLCNLAVSLAKAGRQVVLVEADLRRPYLHQVFETPNKPGLTDVLLNNVSVQDALEPTQVDNLRVLSGGSTVKDPWSLLWQPSMGQMVEALRDTADYVIFNVPSATVFADALCVAPHVDGAILVVRTAENATGAEQQVRQWLDEVNVPVMGVVFNGVPAREMETAEFHRSYGARRADTPALQAPATAPTRRPALSNE